MTADMKIKTGKLSESRREFLQKSGSLTVMSLLGIGFFTACSSDDMEPDLGMDDPIGGNGISIANSIITVDLVQATALNSAGGWALVTEAKVLIVNIGGNQFNALTSVCTHSQCDRNWTFANNVFTCTCHGSRFNTDGTVVNGPANRPLENFPTTLDNNTLTVNFG